MVHKNLFKNLLKSVTVLCNITNIKIGIYYIKNFGLKIFLYKTINKLIKPLKNETQLYQNWIKTNEPHEKELDEQRAPNFKIEPKISIVVPTFNTGKKILMEMIGSVLDQTYSNWELCIADASNQNNEILEILEKFRNKNSKKIKVKFLSKNLGIAGNSNEALSLSTGEYIAFLDHDDTLAPFALYEVVKSINDHPDTDLIYSDEDKMNFSGTERSEPHFKPDWSPDTLRSYNYITHLTVIKRSLLNEVGWFREGFEGSQDYDLILRATEKAKEIIHIPKVLYHWRMSQNSTSTNGLSKPYAFESAKKALSEHLLRNELKGSVKNGLFLASYKIEYNIKMSPKISIIICNFDNSHSLKRCVDSILEKSSFKNFEIIILAKDIIDINSVYSLFQNKRHDLKILKSDDLSEAESKSSSLLKEVTGDVLLFMKNNVKVINSDWIERMLEHVVRKEVGAVGAKSYSSKTSVQHGGIIIGMHNLIGRAHRGNWKNSWGYKGRLQIVQNLSAVSGSCLMIRKEVFTKINVGIFEIFNNFGDIDLCLKLREKGYLIVWTPFSELYEYNLKSKEYSNAFANQENSKSEIKQFQDKWSHVLKRGDPYYNSNLTLDKEDFSFKIQ